MNFLAHYNAIITMQSLLYTPAHRQPINVHLLMALWGQHESILGSLRLRFENQHIPDLYAHFAKPWTYLLHHDMYRRDLDFKNFRVAIHHVNNDLNLNKETRDKIIENYFERVGG